MFWEKLVPFVLEVHVVNSIDKMVQIDILTQNQLPQNAEERKKKVYPKP